MFLVLGMCCLRWQTVVVYIMYKKYPQQNLKYFTKRNFSLRLKTGKTGKLFEG